MYMISVFDPRSIKRVSKILEKRGFGCSFNVDNKYNKPWHILATRKGKASKRVHEIEAVRGVSGAIPIDGETYTAYTTPD